MSAPDYVPKSTLKILLVQEAIIHATPSYEGKISGQDEKWPPCCARKQSAISERQMSSLSAAQMKEYLSKKQSDNAVSNLAIDAARTELTEGQEELFLVSSTMICLTQPTEDLLTAKTTRISAKGSDQRSCRVVLYQSKTNSSKKTQVAECLVVFKVQNLATSVAELPEQPEPSSKPALSTTAEKRQRQIFEAACTVIAKRGFGNASMREISKESGLSVPLMYKYIKDKDDILYLITKQSMQDLFVYFDEHDFETGSPNQNLAAAIDNYLEYIDVNRRYINLVYSETRSLSMENRQKVFDAERELIGRWRSIINDGIARGSFRPMNTELMANVIYFLCAVWSLRHWSIGHIDRDSVHKELKEFVLKGIQNE